MTVHIPDMAIGIRERRDNNLLFDILFSTLLLFLAEVRVIFCKYTVYLFCFAFFCSNIFSIFGNIDRLERGIKAIKAIKNEILHQMECKLIELRTSVVNMIENVGRNKSYADVSRSPSSVQGIEQHSLNGTRTRPEASYIDEGYGDQSGNITNRDTSQTNLKTPYTPETTDKRQSTTNRPTPQPIPVHTTNRNTQNLRQSTNVSHQNNCRGNTTPRHNRTLIIGDSILKGYQLQRPKEWN